MRFAACLALVIGIVASATCSDGKPDAGAYLPGQAAADIMRTAASADVAFLTAGLIAPNYSRERDLASLLQYPQEQLVIVSLTGEQIRAALERSVSLYPQPNTGFLQVSGLEVSFKPSAPTGGRIVSVTVGGEKLDPAKVYSVAAPSSLGRGGCGYFSIWDKRKITKTFSETVESLLKGKKFAESAPRWLEQR